LTIVDPTEAVELLVKFTGGVVGMLPPCAANGMSEAPKAAYVHNFKDAADDISKDSQTVTIGDGDAIAMVVGLVVTLDSLVTNLFSRSKSRRCRPKSTQLPVSKA